MHTNCTGTIKASELTDFLIQQYRVDEAKAKLVIQIFTNRNPEYPVSFTAAFFSTPNKPTKQPNSTATATSSQQSQRQQPIDQRKIRIIAEDLAKTINLKKQYTKSSLSQLIRNNYVDLSDAEIAAIIKALMQVNPHLDVVNAAAAFSPITTTSNNTTTTNQHETTTIVDQLINNELADPT